MDYAFFPKFFEGDYALGNTSQPSTQYKAFSVGLYQVFVLLGITICLMKILSSPKIIQKVVGKVNLNHTSALEFVKVSSVWNVLTTAFKLCF